MAVLTLPARRLDPLGSAGDACVVIPARGGSKGVPRKNLRHLGDEPLVARAVRTVRGTEGVGDVVVSTDDLAIAQAARGVGATVVKRPHWLAGDDASSESALLYTLDALGSRGRLAPVTAFVQATSPFIDPQALGRAIDLVRRGECDVAFSVTASHAHLWRHGTDGPEGVNHRAAVRLRRQDLEPEYRETGAFYVMSTAGFQQARHRFFGRLRMIEVDAADAIEVDDEHDLRLAEVLVRARRAAGTDTADLPITAAAAVIDVDGLGDPVDLFGDPGTARALREVAAHTPVALLSARQHPALDRAAADHGVHAIVSGERKLDALERWAGGHAAPLARVACLGNDALGVACLSAVGRPVVPADARPDCLKAARHVLRRPGAAGAVGELLGRLAPSAPVDPRDALATAVSPSTDSERSGT